MKAWTTAEHSLGLIWTFSATRLDGRNKTCNNGDNQCTDCASLPSFTDRGAMVRHFGLSVYMSVRRRNSKTIAPIYLIFLHKK